MILFRTSHIPLVHDNCILHHHPTSNLIKLLVTDSKVPRDEGARQQPSAGGDTYNSMKELLELFVVIVGLPIPRGCNVSEAVLHCQAPVVAVRKDQRHFPGI